ncbi:MAG: lipoprotein NlpI [Verrucomicrobia bacterium]|nr:MAG: lipoprotein NlpI [Verrucomicrobiota bacterium]
MVGLWLSAGTFCRQLSGDKPETLSFVANFFAMTLHFSRPLLPVLFSLLLGGLSWADDAKTIESAKEAFSRKDFGAAIAALKPILDRDASAASDATQQAKEISAIAHQRRGEDHFRNARIKESIADFDAVIALFPEEAAGHWQRGISLYYAGDYQQGVNQFELHRTVNPEDVENSVWHLLCLVKTEGATLESALQQYLPVTRDRRIPMMQIQNLFNGKGKPEEVIEAAGSASENARFHSDLYLGLYYEMIGEKEKSLKHIAEAAANPTANNYMGDVARTHLLLRGQSDGGGN